MAVDVASGLAAVRLEVEGACQALAMLSPDALHRCEDALQRAEKALRDGRVFWDWKSAGESARMEASRLQAAVRRAGRLLSSACRYHKGWLQILGAMAGGYTTRGDAVPLPGMRRISLEG